MTLRVGILFATLGILGAQQVPPAAPPDDDVTAYLKERRAPALQRMEADALIKAGNVALADKQFDDAAESFRKAIALDPDSSLGMTSLAHVYLARDGKAAAIRFLQSEFAKDPFHALYPLANFADEVGEFDVALDALHKAPAAEISVMLYQRMAALYRRKGDLNGAVDAMRKAQELSRGDNGVDMVLAQDLLAAGRTQEAESLYRASFGVDPNDGPALLRRCKEIGNAWAVSALEYSCVQRAAELMPDSLDALELLAWTNMQFQGSEEQSISIYAKLVGKAPHEYLYHERFAIALSRKGMTTKDQQRHELEAALQCDPPDEARHTIELMIESLDRPTTALRKQDLL
jgi:tetratricopeptide (TPR) repeat protein